MVFFYGGLWCLTLLRHDTSSSPSDAGLCLWLRPGAGFLLRSSSLCLFARAKSFNSCQNGQIGEIHSSDYLHSFRKVTATNKEGYRGGRPLKAVVGVISKAIKKKLGWLFIKTECIRMYSRYYRRALISRCKVWTTGTQLYEPFSTCLWRKVLL